MTQIIKSRKERANFTIEQKLEVLSNPEWVTPLK
jgi:hypothetical protein